MSYIIFLDPLGSKLMGKHNWIQNLNICEIFILSPYTFSQKFGLFQSKIDVKNKQHFFLRGKIKNRFHTNCSIGRYTTFLCNRFLLFHFLEKCFFDTFNTFSEKLPDLRKCQIIQPTMSLWWEICFFCLTNIHGKYFHHIAAILEPPGRSSEPVNKIFLQIHQNAK